MTEPRTWTIALPAGTKLLNANQRLHWAERGKRVKTIRHAAWALARQQQIPCLDKAEVLVDYRPPMAWRRGDAGNWSPSAKAALDGCTDAGVWADDCSKHVLSEKYVIGPKCVGGQLLIHITEVTGTTPATPFHRSDGTWSCTRDGVTEPCGDCDGCRHIAPGAP